MLPQAMPRLLTAMALSQLEPAGAAVDFDLFGNHDRSEASCPKSGVNQTRKRWASLCRNLSSNEWESVWRESGEPGHCEGRRGVGGGKRSGGDGGKGRDGGGDGGMGEAWFF